MKRLLFFTALLSCAALACSAQSFTSGNVTAFVVAASATNTTGSIIELGKTANQTTPINTFTIPASTTTLTNQLRFSGSATSTGYLSNTDDGTLLSFTGANTINTSTNINTILPRGVGTFDGSGTYTLQTTYTGANGNQTRGASSLNNTAWIIGDQGGIYTNGATAASPTGNFRAVKAFGGAAYAATASSVSTISAPTGGTLTSLVSSLTNAQDFYLISSGSNGSTYDVMYILTNSTGSSNTAGAILKYSLVSGVWTANGSYTTAFGGFGLAAEKSGTGANLYISTGAGALAANSVVKVADAAGYNTTISVTTANNLTLYTAATGTIIKGVAFSPVSGVLTTSNPSGLTALNTISGTASTPGSFDVSGTGLTANVTVMSNSANFEISTSSTGTYSSTLTLMPSASTLSATTIYVRSAAGAAAGTNSSTISITSAGASSPTPVAVSGTVTSSTPTLSVSSNSLSGFSTVAGTASTQQSFTVSGMNLTNNATVSVTGPYEISTTSSSGFGTSSITLTQSGGNLIGQPVTIFVRVAASATVGTATGSVTIASSPATSQVVSLSGTVTAPAPVLTVSPASLSGFSASAGTASASQSFTLSGANLTNNVTVTPPSKYEISFDNISFFSTAQTITQSGGTLPGQPVTIYVRLSASAAAGTANQSVSITSTGAATQTVALTGTVTQPTLTASPTSLTGFLGSLGTASASQSFTLTGANLTANAALNVSSGDYEISLDNVNFSTTLSVTPASGTIASTTVYARISASAPGGTANGNVQITSTGATMQNVSLSGTVAGPSITATPTSITGLTTAAGTASTSQSFSVSGSSLSANIGITPSAGLEVSTDNINFYASLSLTPSAGTVSATTVYVRVASSATAGALSGNVALTSTNAAGVTVSAAGFVNAASGSFTGGNVVLLRIGDGSSALANTGNAVFLDEYTPAGTLVNTISVPATNSTGNNLIMSGSATSEGALTRSADGKSLALAGYNKNLPSSTNLGNSAATSVNRVVGLVNFSGTIDLTTSLSDAASANNVRAAYTTDGNAIYVAGGAGGIRYTTLGSTTSTQLSATSTNIRTINVAENSSNAAQLYVGTSSGSLRVATVGVGLPTTSGNTITNLSGFPTTGSPYQFFFADENPAVAGMDVLYVADDAAGIQKYSLVSGSWTANGSTGTGSDGYRGLTGVIDNSTTPSTVTLYATAASGTTSKLVKIVDATGYNASFSSPATTTLATIASSNIAYRGVALSPFNSTATNNTFVGNLSANFNLAQNYGSLTAPTTSTNAIIPAIAAGTMHTPVITGTGNNVQNLTINSGANLKLASGGALNISGTLTNNGTFNTAAGDLNFNGASGTQQVPALTVNNLSFNGNAFSLSGNVTVNGTLTFTSGIVAGNGNKITVAGNAASAVSGGSSASYLSGGTLERVQNSTSSASYFYPVGAGGKYRPVRLTNGSVSGSNTFDVRYFASAYPTLTVSNSSYHTSGIEYWDISRIAGSTSDPIDVSLITDNNTASGIGAPATVEVGHYNGTTWDALGNNSGNTSFGAIGSEIVTTGVTAFSPFTFVSASAANPLAAVALPIQIKSFTAAKAGKDVLLRWKLGEGKAGDQIALQRSTDGIDYKDLMGANIANQYTDEAPAAGLNLYRLKLISANGSAAYSQVLSISFSAEGAISVYPNPATNVLFVAGNGTDKLHCELWNAAGALVTTQDFDGNDVHAISVTDLRAGSYWLSLKSGQEQHRMQVSIAR